MNYTLDFSREAEACLRRLDRRVQERMRAALVRLTADPTGHGTKLLKDVGGRRALRVGGWRVIYMIDRERHIIRIDTIAPRGQVYRRL